ncbi:MAG: CDP-glycerol glycerophosphotransferase family protein [Propionicimonas sp.]|uniref:CDP-glycerol glycerophosphotransferase family protein n=1 Tax=Propionicimonas sp. TaxID=1955623 RepID=UPI002B2004E8|nr:CDP-glycerol glycerophosphotransferase family protein [Propionicimonas sp.]MEA4944214.1 CDP-glycerol glycerophosphotransferase family protein [Propionicimonas sp.]MEA5052459.1 CDP-glycerol glycerophosphotransferase family protein [Propionicimonas sp.]
MSQQAGFSFASGNLRKLLAAPRYLAGRLRAHRSTRDPSLWVIGSAFGVSDGALAFARAAQALPEPPHLVWLADSEAEAQDARQAGFTEVHLKSSREALDRTLHAGLVAVTHGFGDVNRYGVHGAVIVQLWHGAALKKLHADSPVVFGAGLGRIPGMAALMRWAYRQGTGQISLLPVSSRYFQPFMASAFALDESRVRVLGEPRTDVLFTGTPDERMAASRALLESHLGDLGERRVLLYTPTWRDGEPDPAIPDDAEWQLIEDFCQRHDCVMVIRPHRLGVGSYTYTSDRVRLLPASVQSESMPLLWGVDVLITDYSSMLVDYAATGRPILLLTPDLEHYRATRGLYVDYEELSRGTRLRTWGDVVDELEALFDDPGELALAEAHSRELGTRFHAHTDGHSAARAVAAATELVAQRFVRR